MKCHSLRDSSERGDASAVVYAMLPQAALTAQSNTMSSILKPLGNRKLPNPDPSLLVSITNQKENKVASLVITFTFNFGGFCVFSQSKTKVYSIIAFFTALSFVPKAMLAFCYVECMNLLQKVMSFVAVGRFVLSLFVDVVGGRLNLFTKV